MPETDAQLDIGIAKANLQLDPRFATDATSVRIGRLLFRQLVDFDDRNRPTADLARWEALSARRYRFRLIDDGNARFHNGQPITAADAAATYRSILAPETGSPHRGALSHVTAIEVADDRTLEFHLARPDPLFPGRLSIGVLAAAQIAAGAETFTGSGAFEVLRRPVAGVLLLRRRADGVTVAFRQVAEPSVRILKLLRGELDIVQNDLSPELIDFAAAQPGIEVLHARGSNFAYLGFNLEDPVTGRWQFRQAVAHAIDREQIIERLWRRRARPAQSVLTPEHWAGHTGLVAPVHAPQRARALLRDAFPGQERVAVTYKVSTDPLRLRVATILQDQLGRVGIDVRIHSHDWGAFYADIRAGRFQLYSLAWVGIKMPDIFRYLFHSGAVPPGGANRGRFRDARVDRLIDAAEALEPDAAVPVWWEVQQLVHTALPYVPLWYEDQVALVRRPWRGYRLDGDGNYDAVGSVYLGSADAN